MDLQEGVFQLPAQHGSFNPHEKTLQAEASIKVGFELVNVHENL